MYEIINVITYIIIISLMQELQKKSPEIGLLPLALPLVLQSSIRVLVGVPLALVSASHIPANNIDIQVNTFCKLSTFFLHFAFLPIVESAR